MSCAGCKVHDGFFDTWISLQAQIVQELRRLRSAHPSAPLYVTGHSLGGAVATLGSYVLANDLNIPVTATYTYGSPRVGNQAFAEAQRTGHNQWRATHHRDIVPHLPPETLFGFRHTAREVFYDDDSHAGHVCDGTGEDSSCSMRLKPSAP